MPSEAMLQNATARISFCPILQLPAAEVKKVFRLSHSGGPPLLEDLDLVVLLYNNCHVVTVNSEIPVWLEHMYSCINTKNYKFQALVEAASWLPLLICIHCTSHLYKQANRYRPDKSFQAQRPFFEQTNSSRLRNSNGVEFES